MLKSIVVVAGTYLLSVVLVFASGQLLSRVMPDEFAPGHLPSDGALLTSTALFVVVLHPVRVAVRTLRPGARLAARAVVLRHRRSDGRHHDDSQLE
jgi:hypothetical protein